MRVAPAQAIDVQIKLRCLRKRSPEVFSELDRKVSNHLPSRRHFVDEKEPTRQIDHRPAQRLIHRYNCFTVTIDPGFVAERLNEGLAQRDRDVFDGMMIVDLEIAFARHLQVEQSVFGKELEHVFEKRQTDRDTGATAAVEIEFDKHVRFFRLALHVCDS